MREASAGSPARPCAVRSEGSMGGGASTGACLCVSCGAGEDAGRSKGRGRERSGTGGRCAGARGAAAPRCAEAASVDSVKACAGKREASAPPLRRRPRPPRRPRRRFLCAPSAEEVAARDCDSPGAASDSLPGISPSASGRMGSSSSRPGVARTSKLSARSAAGCSAPLSWFVVGTSAPRRVSASSAFFFQSARRKRSTAVLYHFTASSICPAFSSITPSSQATMASRVRW